MPETNPPKNNRGLQPPMLQLHAMPRSGLPPPQVAACNATLKGWRANSPARSRATCWETPRRITARPERALCISRTINSSCLLQSPFLLQPLRQKYLEQRLIRHIALVGQYFQVFDHGHRQPPAGGPYLSPPQKNLGAPGLAFETWDETKPTQELCNTPPPVFPTSMDETLYATRTVLRPSGAL